MTLILRALSLSCQSFRRRKDAYRTLKQMVREIARGTMEHVISLEQRIFAALSRFDINIRLQPVGIEPAIFHSQASQASRQRFAYSRLSSAGLFESVFDCTSAADRCSAYFFDCVFSGIRHRGRRKRAAYESKGIRISDRYLARSVTRNRLSLFIALKMTPRIAAQLE
jgi:hypothetical protein